MDDTADVALTQKPIISRFALYGANGYKDIEFNTDVGVKILVAENGAGKTTLLNALYAVLTGNHRGLLAVEFDSFELEIRGRSWKRSRSDFEAVTTEAYEEIIKSSIWRRLDAPTPTRTEAEELVTAIAEGEDSSLESTRYFSRDVLTRRYPASYLKTMLQDIAGRDFAALVKRRRESFRKLAVEVSEAYRWLYGALSANLPKNRSEFTGVSYPHFSGKEKPSL